MREGVHPGAGLGSIPARRAGRGFVHGLGHAMDDNRRKEEVRPRIGYCQE